MCFRQQGRMHAPKALPMSWLACFRNPLFLHLLAICRCTHAHPPGCRAEGYHDGAVAVLAGGSCEMTACTLDGSGVGGSDSGGGPCLLVDGKGATATARGGAFTGSAQAGVCATRGGSCTLEGCRASGNQDGVAVRGGLLGGGLGSWGTAAARVLAPAAALLRCCCAWPDSAVRHTRVRL